MHVKDSTSILRSHTKKNCEHCHGTGDDLKVKKHEKTGHQCEEDSCNINHSHGHRVNKIFPFEERINALNINLFLKEILLNISYLTPAILVSRVSTKLLSFVTGEKAIPYIVSPLSVSSMFLSNKGLKEIHKPVLISLSSIFLIALKQLVNLPRWLMRTLVALAVDMINKIGKDKQTSSDKSLTKEDLIKHIRLQTLVNLVPPGINFFLNKITEKFSYLTSPVGKVLTDTSLIFAQIAGLAFGFSSFGYLIDKGLKRFDLITNGENLAGKTESTVCACCGAPFCVAEAASEVGSLSLAA